MEPAYVTFEQAKWLKEKGFNLDSKKGFDDTERVVSFGRKRDYYLLSDIYYNNDLLPYKENVPHYPKTFICTAPEQWQVIEWLRVKHGIWVTSNPLGDKKDWVRWDYKILDLKNSNCLIDYEMSQLNKSYEELLRNSFNSPQEAYSAALDYIKNNNLI
jgi:hypothetical protein